MNPRLLLTIGFGVITGFGGVSSCTKVYSFEAVLEIPYLFINLSLVIFTLHVIWYDVALDDGSSVPWSGVNVAV